MILLDTNIVSFLLKQDTRIELYRPYLRDHNWGICLMTVAELFLWAGVYKWVPSRRTNLKNWLDENFTQFSFDWETSCLWGQVVTECRSKGRPISAQDAWIASSALQHDLTLVTHNAKDFRAIQSLQIYTAI